MPVGQTIFAGNVLRSFDCVDGTKVGISGISWGCVITSIVIGYDIECVCDVSGKNLVSASQYIEL